jgi:hypothetical protein
MAARNIHSAFRKAVCQEIEIEREFTLRERCEKSLAAIGSEMGMDQRAANIAKLSAIEKALDRLEKLPAEFRVTVKVVKENAFSVLNNNETVFRLVSAGMITPDVGLQLLIFDGKDQAVQLMKAKALELALAAAAGAGGMNNGNNTP